MPIENERKFVLDHANPQKFQNKLKALPGATSYEFQQGYLDGTARIRRIVDQATGETHNVFTYKTKVNKDLIEIETEISDDDFNALWIKVDKVITKIRVKVPETDHLWEVDFFTAANQDGYYLIMAEVELDPTAEMPNTVPSYIDNNLVHLVAVDDKRFGNRQLTRPVTVKKLVEELKNGKL